jgi:glycosyltransferase involved in cell wall biosynthesis
MTFKPKVSIVIPVYNGSNYLREAIDSALAQTYENVEVIVVNDGSDDGGKTEEIARSYGDRIRYFYKENGGVSTALNYGIENMSGEWFSWLSHDDLYSPNRIEEDVKVFRTNPTATVSFCSCVIVDGNGDVVKKVPVPTKSITNPWEAMIADVYFCSLTIHRSCFEVVGLFNENNKTIQDIEMILSLSRKYKWYLNDKAWVYKREHEDRGLYRLKELHCKDGLALMEKVHESYSISDFFPDIENAKKEKLAYAWNWLGDFYLLFGAYDYADECYNLGFKAHKKIVSRIALKKLMGARILDSNFFKKYVMFYK